MATNIIPFSSSGNDVPAHITALFGEDGNIAIRISIDQLSYRGKVWRRIVGGEETQLTRTNADGDAEPVPIVSVVVLDHNKSRSRAYYKGNFEEGKNATPDCTSSDGITPDADVKEPCAKTCAACPNSVKGSKITENGKQSTLCSPFKRVAIVPAQGLGSHPVMLLRLAQTSMWDKDNGENEAKGWYAWDQYLDMLRARGAKHTAAVETKVKFDLRMAYPKLLFSASRWLNPEETTAAKARIAESTAVIEKILSGAGNDGVAGQPAALPGYVADDNDASAVAAQAAAAEAAKKATAKAAKKAAADKALADAQAAAAAADADDDEEGGGFGEVAAAVVAAPVKPAAKAVTAAKAPKAAAATPVEAPAVVEGTPAGLADLLSGWDA
jgi:hypothetical protein